MRWARKKLIRIQAWQLGQGTLMERKMIEEGRIVKRNDGQYELFSQEATGTVGQITQAGDYFKVDATGHPYPNEKAKFEHSHRHLEGDWYEQISVPVRIWTVDDPECEEIRFLLSTGCLQIHPENPQHYFSAKLWGTEETAPQDAVVVFYSVEWDETNAIREIDYNFVVREEFERTYEVITHEV